jgi:hypothetical protein
MKYSPFFSSTVIFLCSLIISPHIKGQKRSDHDTGYFVTYPRTIVGRFYFSKKYTSVILPAANNEQDLKYKPNTQLTMGIGATYNNLTLNIAYGFGFLNHDDEKGKTKSIDLQAHLFPRKWAVDLLAVKHKGLFLDPRGYASDKPESYYYRPDIQELFIGFSAYRVLNAQRFSYNAAMMQNEWQKKSAGSLMLGALTYYGQIKGDSSLVPTHVENSFPFAYGIDNINFFAVGIGGGYAYTLVIAKHFYVTGSLIANLDVAFSAVENIDDKKNKTSVRTATIYKAAAGYNSNSWNISANWAANDSWVRGNHFSQNFYVPIGNYRIILSKKIALKKH